MCGIAGLALPDDVLPDAALVRAMADRLAHRGPDAHGVLAMPGCTFGHRRLSIVDLSDLAAQPMRSPDESAMLTFNGEIYDFAALRDELAAQGYAFRGRSDTEVLLHALDAWGDGALQRIHGMFAFGHWSARDRALTLVRDRFGKKPLYYAPLGDDSGRGGVAFASELSALLVHPEVRARREVDPVAVAQYLVHEFVPQPRSILAQVRKLGPGERLRWSAREGITHERWWAPRTGVRLRGDERELTQELSRRVERAVSRRLVADVPVGVFLSGGIDSSFVAACAAATHPRVKTFAIGFDDPSFDESAHAELVARHLGTDHVTEVLSERALIDLVAPTLDAMDEPHADSSILPTTMLARLARRDVTVALGGDGGDEILAGYPTFVADQVLSRLPTSATAGRLLGALARLMPATDANFSTAFKLQQMAQGMRSRGAERHARWLAPVDPDSLPSLLGDALRSGAAHSLDAARAAGLGAATDFDAATAFYLQVYLSEGVLQKVDRATMRVSLEARAPLLDTDVVTFCLALPERLRLRGTTTKYLLRKALGARVPKSILERPKKGFGAPVGRWLRGPLRELMLDTLSPARLRATGWFSPAVVERAMSEHLSGARDHRKLLYSLLVLEHWRRRWLEAA
ncbi:MAG: asparagine synthase (glutamine-hydrolyzing) [Deltaproteobacteria bacterium]|nr:asparagine synthase (glutamine-hydrolyzing) [Deltaproteobacteria bacterium]